MSNRPLPPLVVTVDNRLGRCPREVFHPKGWQLAKIPDEVRKCVAYACFRSKNNCEPWGTVFFVAYEIEHFEHNSLAYMPRWTYAVTSRHVIENIKTRSIDGNVHLAMNGNDGVTTIVQIPITSWHFPAGERSDVAIVEIEFDLAAYDHLCFPRRGFACPSDLTEWEIGPGDEVYFSGLFTKRPGSPVNVPIIRTGSIAALPAGDIRTKYSDTDAYLVEARSIGGMSGSPVFYSQDQGMRFHSRDYEPPNSAHGLYLLGYVQGHYDENDAGDKFNMGIAVVVSAGEILTAFECPPLAAKREREFAAGLQEFKERSMPNGD